MGCLCWNFHMLYDRQFQYTLVLLYICVKTHNVHRNKKCSVFHICLFSERYDFCDFDISCRRISTGGVRTGRLGKTTLQSITIWFFFLTTYPRVDDSLFLINFIHENGYVLWSPVTCLKHKQGKLATLFHVWIRSNFEKMHERHRTLINNK